MLQAERLLAPHAVSPHEVGGQMPVKPEDVKEGKCYSTKIKGRSAIIRVIAIKELTTEFTELAGTPNARTTVRNPKRVKWEYRFMVPPKDRWKQGNNVATMRDFLMAIEKEVDCS
jgi:hypothetical protein